MVKHYAQGIRVILCFEEPCISNILLDVASGEKPKSFFPLTETMPFNLHNSNFDHI